VPRKAKANRSDLNVPKVTVPGQDYGKQAAQAQAMKVVPMAGQEMAPAQMAAQAPMQMTAPRATPPIQPGDLKFLHETDRPQEPITHGLPVGPGAGPEVMTPGPGQNVSAILQHLAASPFAGAELQQLANYAQHLGF
jgi:hypothetical protein